MQKRNPYAISFGRIPTQYINRNAIIDSVIDAIDSDYVDEQAFKLTGIHGTGKTVTLSAIEKKLKNDEHSLSNEVLRQFDDALAEKVYNKIWSELAPKDQWFLKFIAERDQLERYCKKIVHFYQFWGKI